MRTITRIKGALLLALAGFLAIAVDRASAQAINPVEDAQGMIALNLPEEVDLKALIEYVGKRNGINFIYDEQIGARKLTIKATQKIPADSLLTLLDSALKMKGLALAKTEVPNMMRVEVAKSLAAVSVGPTDGKDVGKGRPTLAVTTVFPLKHANAQRVETVMTPFLSVATASLVVLPEQRIAIVTDYADNMKKLEELLAMVDRPGRDVQVKFVPVAHLESDAMAQKVTALLAGKARASQGTASAGAPAAGANVTLVADDRTNQLVVIGEQDGVGEAMALVQSLDIPLALKTKVYRMVNASPDQVDRIVKRLIGEMAAKRLYKSATEPDASLLIATTTPEIHEQIEALRVALDKPRDDEQSPIRFYRLENAKAADILATLQALEGDGGLENVTLDGVSIDRQKPVEPIIRGPTEAQINPSAPDPLAPFVNQGKSSVKLRDARVVADEPTNTIIVMAKPWTHSVYEKLIKRLDVRRPQVLVEATVVALDTTDNFSLGVEIHTKTSASGGSLLNFTQFGLTTKDSLPGSLTLSPGTGFTGALLNADVAEVVIKALQTDKRAKVVSKPSVLINDNAEGTLTSEAEEPFASVNASSTVATTSFAGYSSAGTNIKITPQISEGQYLKLKYDITLSSFGDLRDDTLPPSRQKNSLTSEATIPDGHTIVVGGLTRENYADNVDRVPVLGSIPVLEYLLSSRSSNKSRTTLFVFIRAVVLRDDKFKDLKAISSVAANKAEMPSDFPSSQPVEIK